MINVSVTSETGNLESVLLHRPGVEIERMTPDNAKQALYSDLLSYPIAQKEYSFFEQVIGKWGTQIYQVSDLLEQTLQNEYAKKIIIEAFCKADQCEFLQDELFALPNAVLAHSLIEGYEYQSHHPQAKAEERYILKPLFNLFFTRDIASVVYDTVIINSMATAVRAKESMLASVIFQHLFNQNTFSPIQSDIKAHTEGGDILVVSENILFIGVAARSNMQGVNTLINYFKKQKPKFHILVQELPTHPESFIHLDMVFTLLDKNTCMVFDPLIKKSQAFSQYKTTLIEIDNGNVRYHEKADFFQGVKDLGLDLKPVLCGGNDAWYQAREQWHSGANFFALGEGKIIGYARNIRTIEALDKEGFAVLPAHDICNGAIDMKTYSRFVAAIQASELPRGGGGARCMTMPLRRS